MTVDIKGIHDLSGLKKDHPFKGSFKVSGIYFSHQPERKAVIP